MSLGKKILLVVIGVVGVGMIAGTIYVLSTFQNIVNGPEKAELEIPSIVEEPFDSKKYKERVDLGSLTTEESYKAVDSLKAALKANMEVTEYSTIQFMHYLTHQKVQAKVKWVSIEMTPEITELLVQVIEQKGTSWVHYADLIDMANRWTNEDFSSADKDHNYLWKLLDGNIGKANRVFSREEEAEFIEKTFRK